MAKKLIQRKSADKTRTTILKAARKLFAKAGFSATSTQAIAKAAQVNENLIFHHFSNKAELWRKVKESIVEELAIEPLDKQPESFQDFLTAAVRQRLSAFQQHPDLVRLLRWQAMESKREQLIAGNILAPKNWLEPICYLQKNGKIKSTIKPELLVVWLAVSVNAIIFDDLHLFDSDSDQQNYIDFIVKNLGACVSCQ